MLSEHVLVETLFRLFTLTKNSFFLIGFPSIDHFCTHDNSTCTIFWNITNWANLNTQKDILLHWNSKFKGN